MSTKYRKNIVYKNNILCFGLNTFKASNHGRLDCFDKKVTIKVLPETVQNFKVKALSGGKIKCTWKGKSTKNTNCQIQYSLNKQFKNVKTFASKPSLKSGSYKGKGLKKGKTYYLRIRAIAKFGGKSYTGKWSKTIKVKVK